MNVSANLSPELKAWAENPDNLGHFGPYGGRFVPETLMPALQELIDAYEKYKDAPEFVAELTQMQKDYVGRATPLYEAQKLSAQLGLRIFLKREDLTHTGAHKINNALGQVLLARRMGKKRIIAETGAGQHGVATATAAALMGMECVVHMGTLDIERQALNVVRMKMLGATVAPVTTGSCSLKDACNAAIRDWVTNVENTHYIIGSVLGPHPYPMIVRDFQAVIGREARAQMLEQAGELPDALVACVGGGSNAMGLFYPFLGDDVKMYGVEAAGHGLESGQHSAPLNVGKVGTLHGARQYLMMTDEGQIHEAHSIAAGLDYPGVGPEHCLLKDLGRAEYGYINDKEALEGFFMLTRTEGIIPALESSHAIAYLKKLAEVLPQNSKVLVCLSGRGDKDVAQVAAAMEEK